MKYIIVLLLIIKLSTCQIAWTGNWAFACDFPGNDIGNALTKGQDCSDTCQRTAGCTHFSWTTYNGGTCWMKKGGLGKQDAVFTNDFTMVCGVLDQGVESLKGQLLWSDEFDSYGPFQNNWIQETGGWGWGNNELQYYTNNNENTEISGGMLTIHTRKENKGNNRFTSARLISSKSFKYGIFEMRAKLPFGRGTWPAFWLLAAKRPLNWPQDGEIDIMEHVGYDQNVVHATIHCKAYNHIDGTQIGKSTRVDDVSNKFHLYQLYWSEKSIRAYIDNKLYFQIDRPANANQDTWPFDNQFQILINTAVGGDWGGALGVDESVYPQRFVVDYVRQYAYKN